MRAPHLTLPLALILIASACDETVEPDVDAGVATDAGARVDAARPPDAGTTDASAPVDGGADPDCASAGESDTFCVCGCGVADPDCPSPPDVEACDWDGCDRAVERPDPADLTRCAPIDFPDGWTCGAAEYLDDVFYFAEDGVTRNSCTCGCGALDDVGCATAPATQDDCESDGCGDGFAPDPDDLDGCIALPAGWTCSWERYYDDACHCGCGIADPSCVADPHHTDCDVDGCPSGESPDPLDLTQCIANAPQDRWTCDLAALDDGATCDCGCEAIDTDCPASATASDCDVTHCTTGDELEPGDIATCREICTPAGGDFGSATCTNGGMVSIGSSCVRNLSACDDGNRYEIECSGGECLCRLNSSCVSRHAAGGCNFSTCGWTLIDAT